MEWGASCSNEVRLMISRGQLWDKAVPDITGTTNLVVSILLWCELIKKTVTGLYGPSRLQVKRIKT